MRIAVNHLTFAEPIPASVIESAQDAVRAVVEAGGLDARLVLRPTINHPDLTYLLEKDDQVPGIRLRLGRDQGRPADFLEIDGGVTAGHAAELEDAIWQHLPGLRAIGAEKFGAYQDRAEERHSQTLALAQLLIAYHVLRKYSDVSELPFAPPVAALSRVNSARVAVPEV